MTPLPWLDACLPEQPFPPIECALDEPNGLLAIGGDLHPKRLLNAYRHGIFPWFEEGQPPLWWSPDPRSVLFIEEFRLSRSLRKRLRNSGLSITLDTHFPQVMQACAGPRQNQQGTWITSAMRVAYEKLHSLGHAHSTEVWDEDGRLVGGLYGIALGRMFFGESMFSRCPDASKIALATLACQLQRWGFRMIDCQQPTDHLMSLGAREIARSKFAKILNQDCQLPGLVGTWRIEEQLKVDRWTPSLETL